MIKTNRLNLRAWRTEDLGFLDVVLGDADVMEFSDRGVLSKDEQTTWLKDAVASQHDAPPFRNLAIEHEREGGVIGYISLSNDLSRVAKGDVEVGFRLARSAWGRGYATEVLTRVTELSRDFIQADRIVAIVDPNNHRSVRVLKKTGMTYQGDVMFDGYDYPDHLYASNLTFRLPATATQASGG